MVVKSDKTTIQISKNLRERLILKKRGNDTYDDVIEKMIISHSDHTQVK